MQTTLLGLAIAFILALITALVGPYFVDWNQFRPQFEAEASRVIGAPVRVGGKLDALLLPTPTLRLREIAVGGDNDPAKVRADKLDVEFNLGALMRGEWRASVLSLEGFVLDLGFDRQGRVEWPVQPGRFNLGMLAIDRMNVAGRLALHDASSGRVLHADDLSFSGDVRGAAGSLRGEGSFTLLGAKTPFRVSSGQTNDGKGTRVRFIADPGERSLSADLDGVLTFDNLVPKFEGGLTLARPADPKAPDSAWPWRLSSRVKANPSSATFEQVEAAYGAEDNALRLAGNGDIRFGASPLLHLALSARQLDADRLLTHGTANAEPLRLLPALRSLVTSMPRLPLPAQIDVSADQIALGGRPLQSVAIALRGDDTLWSVGKLNLRAPGSTRVAASGVIAESGPWARFTGPVSIESPDPETFTAWLQGRSDVTWRSQKPLRLTGEATVAADCIALDHLTGDINGGAATGRLAMVTTADGKTRFEAALKAAALDVDGVSTFVTSLAGPQSAWPDEAKVSLEADGATFAGQTMRPAAVSLSYGPKTIALERIAAGDANSDVAINGSGSFDRTDGAGKLTLTAAAPSLAQMSSFIAPLAPTLAERMAAVAKEPGAARVQLNAEMGKPKDRSGRSDVRATLDLDMPQVRGAVTLTGKPVIDLANGFDLKALNGSDINVETKLDAGQTASMLAALGLDRIVSARDGPAHFESSATGAWGAPLQIKAKLAGAGADGEIEGTGNPWAEKPAAALVLKLRHADLGALFDLGPASLPSRDVALSSRLAVDGDTFTFDNLDATAGGSRLRGRLALTRGDLIGVDGEIGMDTLDLASATSLAFGAAGREESAPLGRGWLRGWRGRLAFQALKGVLPGGGEVRPVGGAIKGDGQSLVLEGAKGSIGGGEAALDLDARQTVQGTNQGTSFNARLQLSNVDGAVLRYRGLAMPHGKTALQMTLAGQGRSAAGLSGALSGAGTLTLTDARIAGLDPQAFEAGIRAGGAGQATDDLKLKEIVAPMLAAGGLTVPSMQIPFIIRDGRLRIESASFDTDRVRVAIAGGYDLLADQADLRAVMTPINTRPISGRPDIRVDLNGSPDALARTVDVAGFQSWLSMRAIDRETRRLDQLERGVTSTPEPDVLWDETLPKVDPLGPSDVRVPVRDPRRKSPVPKAAAPRPPVAPQPHVVRNPPSDPHPGSAQAQPLPPPINIKPAPGVLQKSRPAPPPAPRTF